MSLERFAVSYAPRNQWLRRKVDRTRYAQLLLYAAVGIFALLAAVAATWPHLEAIRLGYRVEELRLERDELEKDIERSRLSLSEITAPRTVETVAREKHGLEPPETRVVLEAPTPAAAALLGSGGGGFR